MNYTNAEITERRAADLPDASEVQTYRNYAAGEHRETLTPKQSALLKQRSAHRMVDNVLDLILKTTASRLRLTEWAVQGDEPRDIVTGAVVPETEVSAVTSHLQSLWMLNRVQRLQHEVHYAALRDGNSAVSLVYRGGRVHLWRESWWDGDTGVYIAYSDAGEYEFAVKEWDQREQNGTITRRRTVYEPGVITRWQQDGNGWKPFGGGTDENVEKMMRGTADQPRPLAIPLVHFPSGTNITDTHYGASDIATLLALQDDVNATQMDISAAAMMTAFQRIFFAGVARQNKITLEPGGAFGDENDKASLTVVPAGDVSNLITVRKDKREAMAHNSRTPMHAITGEWPSGVALLQADMPQIDKVTTMGDVVGPQWTMVAHRAMELANVFGRLDLNEQVPVTSVFAPAERLDELTEYEIKQAHAMYWETIARLPLEAMIQAGVDPATAQTLADQRDAMTSVIAEAGF